MAGLEVVGGIEIIDNFRRIAELDAALDNRPSSDLVAEKGELLTSLADSLVDSKVEITELPSVRENDEERPITRYGEVNSGQMVWMADRDRAAGRRRRHPITHAEYGINDFFRHPKRSRGLVEAIDRYDASIVVHPWLLGISGLKFPLSRQWVKVFSSEGEQLVDLAVVGQ